MRKIITLLLSLTTLSALLTGCAASAEQHMGEAQGYGGTLQVAVSMNGTDITAVKVTSHSETEGVGTRAIDALPGRIAEADSVQVDSVSGATVTSEAIKEAVAQAISGVSMPNVLDMSGVTATDTPAASPAMTGVGMAATGRIGPGEGVHSFNVVFACAGFDEGGRILTLDVDQLEVLSSEFGGFPADAEGEEEFLSRVTQWTSKGAKGESYMLQSGSWRAQMDAFEDAMTGMTIDEINAWFEANFDPETGKPANTDAVAGATMSLRDEHGDILTAIQRAWEDAQRRQGSQESTTPESTMTDTNTEADGESTVG